MHLTPEFYRTKGNGNKGIEGKCSVRYKWKKGQGSGGYKRNSGKMFSAI